jgi:hypothetical protein
MTIFKGIVSQEFEMPAVVQIKVPILCFEIVDEDRIFAVAMDMAAGKMQCLMLKSLEDVQSPISTVSLPDKVMPKPKSKKDDIQLAFCCHMDNLFAVNICGDEKIYILERRDSELQVLKTVVVLGKPQIEDMCWKQAGKSLIILVDKGAAMTTIEIEAEPQFKTVTLLTPEMEGLPRIMADALRSPEFNSNGGCVGILSNVLYLGNDNLHGVLCFDSESLTFLGWLPFCARKIRIPRNKKSIVFTVTSMGGSALDSAALIFGILN